MRSTRWLAPALTLAVSAGCHRQARLSASDLVLDAIRAEERGAGLTHAESLGKDLFVQYCTTCHGDGGKGDGQNAFNLVPPPPDLTASKHASDAVYLRKVIIGGSASVGRSSLSPPWGRALTAQDIEYLTGYCQALGRKK
jgi:mono/diheme cytochrome c family protein